MVYRTYNEEDYVDIGSRFSSDDVAQEAAEVIVRWQGDLDVLTRYGHGERTLERFQALAEEQKGLRTNRPTAVAEKTSAIKARKKELKKGWEWFDQASMALSIVAENDSKLADALNAAHPKDDVALAPGIRAFTSILAENKDHVDPSFGADEHVTKGMAIAENIEIHMADAQRAKETPKTDTRTLDLIEGKIVVAISRLNKAAKKAFRKAENDVKVQAYQYRNLKKSPGKKEEK